jgi:tetratricopeptide (TPR) repeat protein
MTDNSNVAENLKNFDALWNLGDPEIIEKRFQELLPHAEKCADKSIYLQLLSQLALTQALQKKFVDAHKTLDLAEKQLESEYLVAKVRIILERGRAFQQEAMVLQKVEKIAKAIAHFELSYEISLNNSLDFHAINAAHMIAIAAPEANNKIKWNLLAIDLTEKTRDEKAKAWLGSLYSNLGQNYIETKQYEDALTVLEKTLEIRKKEHYEPNVRIAKWALARALRFLGRLDEALLILIPLLNEYDALSESGLYDFPQSMLQSFRGLVYEELAEAYNSKARVYAKLAYEDLSQDEMFSKTEPERLISLKNLA